MSMLFSKGASPHTSALRVRIIAVVMTTALLTMTVLLTVVCSPWHVRDESQVHVLWTVLVMYWIISWALVVWIWWSGRKLIRSINRDATPPVEEALVSIVPGVHVRATAADGTREVVEGILLPYSEAEGERVWANNNRGIVRVMVGSIKVSS